MAALPGLPASEHYWHWYHWVARCRLSAQQQLYAGQLGPGSVGSLTALTQGSTLRLRSFFLKKKITFLSHCIINYSERRTKLQDRFGDEDQVLQESVYAHAQVSRFSSQEHYPEYTSVLTHFSGYAGPRWFLLHSECIVRNTGFPLRGEWDIKRKLHFE